MAHKDLIKKRRKAKEYRDRPENKLKRKQYQKKYLEKPDIKSKMKSYRAKYFQKHKDKLSKLNRQWAKGHPVEIRKSMLKTEYGITLEQYDEMFEQQNGVCAICNHPETKKHQSGGIRRLCVDHNHKTGKIRGLLCDKCNRLVGAANDSTEILALAIKYLSLEKDI